jgi:hypothetical protein
MRWRSVGREEKSSGLFQVPTDDLRKHLRSERENWFCESTPDGLNTTLESLAQGVPMVAIPIGYDQPGIAARNHGVGEFVEVEDLAIDGLPRLIAKVLREPGYRSRAEYFRRVIAKTRGLDLPGDMIERAFITRADVAPVNAK